MEGTQHNQNVDDLDNPRLSQAFKFFCRHLVTLDCLWQPLDDNGKPKGQIQPLSYPGVILSVYGSWLFVTAGHAFRSINDYLKSPEVKSGGFCLRDHYGPESTDKHPIQLSYEDSPQFAIDDKAAGLDFGVLALNSNQRALLIQNGIIPISEEHWERQHEIEFDRHFMLGIPEKSVRLDSVCPTRIPIVEIRGLPDGVAPTKYPRFIGKLDDSIDIDIKGMSGGPIFGIEKGSDVRYQIVAIQSTWLSKRKITFGCPVPVFARLVQSSCTAALRDEFAAQASK